MLLFCEICTITSKDKLFSFSEQREFDPMLSRTILYIVAYGKPLTELHTQFPSKYIHLFENPR